MSGRIPTGETAKPRLVAIIGGSGSGKTHLARMIRDRLGAKLLCIALDDFYRDRSSLSPARRAAINFDHPRAMDWAALRRVLKRLAAGRPARLPQYDFATHTRKRSGKIVRPKPLIVVEGIWPCHPRAVRELFHRRIYLACPAALRWGRRLRRDVAERGRTPESVRQQYISTVAPMHRRFVAPQAQWCELILRRPLRPRDLPPLLDFLLG